MSTALTKEVGMFGRQSLNDSLRFPASGVYTPSPGYSIKH